MRNVVVLVADTLAGISWRLEEVPPSSAIYSFLTDCTTRVVYRDAQRFDQRTLLLMQREPIDSVGKDCQAFQCGYANALDSQTGQRASSLRELHAQY